MTYDPPTVYCLRAYTMPYPQIASAETQTVLEKMDCKICKSPKATIHNFYGATSVCHSCRGFFMRSVHSGLYKVFCQGHASKCEINSNNRKSCKKCRFEKCLKVGMKIAYVKSLEERCKRVIASQNIEKPKLSEYFEEKYALNEYSDKKVQLEIKFLFEFYEDKPDLFLRHFVVGMPDYKPTDQDLDDWSKLDYMFIKHSIGIFGEMDNVTEDINVLFNHNYQRVRTFLYMSIFVSIYFIFYALLFNFVFYVSEKENTIA